MDNILEFVNGLCGAEMLDSDNPYIRTRGLLLISANAKWDSDNKIDEIKVQAGLS